MIKNCDNEASMIKIQNIVGMIIRPVPDMRAMKYLSSKEIRLSFLVNCIEVQYPKNISNMGGSKLPKKSNRREIMFSSLTSVYQKFCLEI